MDLATILTAARAIGPVLGKLPEIRAVIDGAVSLLSNDDQDEAKKALAALRAENDATHARLQGKLSAAAGEGGDGLG